MTSKEELKKKNLELAKQCGIDLTPQPSKFEQCIKKWNKNGFDVDIYALEIVIANYSTAKCEADEVEFSIDLSSKQVNMPNGCYAKLPFKIYHLLSKTIKSLEVEKHVD